MLPSHTHTRTQVLPTVMPAPRDLFSFVHELLPAMRGSNGVASALASDGVVDWLLDQVVQIINGALRFAVAL